MCSVGSLHSCPNSNSFLYLITEAIDVNPIALKAKSVLQHVGSFCMNFMQNMWALSMAKISALLNKLKSSYP